MTNPHPNTQLRNEILLTNRAAATAIPNSANSSTLHQDDTFDEPNIYLPAAIELNNKLET